MRLAPAKINLVLEVGGRRPDGFHELHSVFAPLTLADRLSVRLADLGPRRGGDPDHGDRLVVTGTDDVPVTGNLVLRAAALLREEAGRPLPPLAFRLAKRVPAAAGLGGGSSDASAALDLAAAAWGLRLAPRRRLELAAALGSDVPFFALGGWAEVRGRGERLRRLPPPAGGPLGVLLAVPAARLSTAAVFGRFDADGVAARRGARRAATDGDEPFTLATEGDESRARTYGDQRPAAIAAADHDEPHGGTDGDEQATGTATAVADADQPRTLAAATSHAGSASRLAAMLRAGADARAVAAITPANDLVDAATALLPDLARLRTDLAALLRRPVHLSGSGPALAVLYPSPWAARSAARIARAAAHDLGGTCGPLVIIATSTAGGEP